MLEVPLARRLRRAACLAAIVSISAIVLASCGGDDEAKKGSGSANAAGQLPEASPDDGPPPMKATDPRICFEAGTTVRDDYSQSTDQELLARVRKQGGGYLDVDFADVYFFKDAASARKEADAVVASIRKAFSAQEAKELRELGADPYENYELRGNVLVAYHAADAEEKSHTNGCLSDAGERQPVAPE